MKKLLFILLLFPFTFQLKAQTATCTFKQPLVTIHFGSGDVQDFNTVTPSTYGRVTGACPTDGHYSYIAATSDCFRGDWFTLQEDHTPGDVGGNMMLVNASYSGGAFFSTIIKGLKAQTTYEFAVWLMNVCRISDKCPFPLLPNILIRLQTPSGKVVAQFSTGEIVRHDVPHWTPYRALFTTPPATTSLILTMIDNTQGGCGNDFAMDDITFRECVKQIPIVTNQPKPPVIAKKRPAISKPVAKKEQPAPVNKQPQSSPVAKLPTETPKSSSILRQRPIVFPPPPSILTIRTNPLVKQIETEAGDIQISLYDNGEIDGDTVSIYHNNVLQVAHAGLTQKPVSFHISVDPEHPHHELIMVADNLGSIPPNTSLMIVTTGTKRYEVFISSTEQKNAKVIIDLKE